MDNLQRYHKTIATVIVVALIAFVLFLASPFINSFLSAFILFVMFRPLYRWFVRKNLPKGASAALILVIVALVVMIPLALGINILVKEISYLTANQDDIIQKFNEFDSRFPGINFSSLLNTELSNGEQYIKNATMAIIQNTSKIVVSLIIVFFTLYFLLIHSEELAASIRKYSPFSKKNTNKMYDELRNITNSTILTTGIISLFQGLMLCIGFLIFGIKGAIFWGFIGVILAFLPFVGVSLIWVPAGLIQIFFMDNYVAGIGIMVWGVILSNTDNLVRPYLQKKIGKIHPFITLAGVFMGLPVFGLLGLFIGPLLLSFSVLITKIYFEEYVTDK